MRAVIIDDERGARETLRGLIAMYCPEIVVVGEAGTIEKGIELINASNPDLLLLDIQLQHKTSFELLERIDSQNFALIFVTAYNQFALRAIKFSAIDYLLKPVDPRELVAAVKKMKDDGTSGVRYNVLREQMQEPDTDTIVLQHSKGFTVVRFNEIIRCLANRNYTHIFFTNGTQLMVSKTLKEFEELLEPHGFMRVHQSHLIRLAAVKNYVRGRQGTIELVDGSSVNLARSRKEEFLRLFTNKMES